MSNLATTIEAKHIFIDIVNYTYNRSIEAQTELIAILNKIVKQSVRKNRIKQESVVYIPTGDGMCISLINITKPFDVHLLISLDILRYVEEHNNETENSMRRFSLRIGVNENIDNLIIDINKQRNISGSGINFASRILSLCDANQIIVSNTVFDRLIQREKYLNSFDSYTGEVKHNIPLKVHRYKNSNLTFLNSEVPSVFKAIPKTEIKLPNLIAYYFAHCILNEEFNTGNVTRGQSMYSLRVLNFYLAQDSLAKSRITKTEPEARKKIKGTIQEFFDYLQNIEFWVICDLSKYIIDVHLSNFDAFFSEGNLFLNARGIQKLKIEHPSICEELGIE